MNVSEHSSACIICFSLAHTHLSFSCSLLTVSIHIIHFSKDKTESVTNVLFRFTYVSGIY